MVDARWGRTSLERPSLEPRPCGRQSCGKRLRSPMINEVDSLVLLSSRTHEAFPKVPRGSAKRTEDALPHGERSHRVSVVIPNWNGADLLRDVCLPSLTGQTFRDFSVIVVDNGSSDGSVEYLATAWASVFTLGLDRNFGFATAVNRGIMASQSEYIALVNNDVELDPNWLAELVANLVKNPSAGSATGKMLDFRDRTKLVSAGLTLHWNGRFKERGRGEEDSGQYDQCEEIFSATAGAGLYRRSAFQSVGLFDDDFFAYAEDVDWAFRAHTEGLTSLYVPSAVSYHLGSATSGRLPGLYSYLIIRNSIWFVLKNFPASKLRKSWPAIVGLLLLRSYSTMRRGDAKLVLRAWAAASLGLRKTLRKRREIQSRRKVDQAELDRLFTSRS
jgi:GT2 family glycosyltransferase